MHVSFFALQIVFFSATNASVERIQVHYKRVGLQLWIVLSICIVV